MNTKILNNLAIVLQCLGCGAIPFALLVVIGGLSDDEGVAAAQFYNHMGCLSFAIASMLFTFFVLVWQRKTIEERAMIRFVSATLMMLGAGLIIIGIAYLFVLAIFEVSPYTPFWNLGFLVRVIGYEMLMLTCIRIMWMLQHGSHQELHHGNRNGVQK